MNDDLNRYVNLLKQSGQIERVDRNNMTFVADLIFAVFTVTMLAIAAAALLW